MSGWYREDWDERFGLVAAFPDLDRSGALHVDYAVEEEGRSYLTESALFALNGYGDKWWASAFGAIDEN